MFVVQVHDLAVSIDLMAGTSVPPSGPAPAIAEKLRPENEDRFAPRSRSPIRWIEFFVKALKDESAS